MRLNEKLTGSSVFSFLSENMRSPCSLTGTAPKLNSLCDAATLRRTALPLSGMLNSWPVCLTTIFVFIIICSTSSVDSCASVVVNPVMGAGVAGGWNVNSTSTLENGWITPFEGRTTITSLELRFASTRSHSSCGASASSAPSPSGVPSDGNPVRSENVASCGPLLTRSAFTVLD